MSFKLKITGNSNRKSQNSFSPLPPGTYEATLSHVEENNNANRHYIRWLFTIKTTDGERRIMSPSPIDIKPGSKTRYWIENLLNRELQDGEEIELESLIGRSCRLLLSEVTLADGRNVNRVDRLFSRAGTTSCSEDDPEADQSEDFNDVF